MKTPSLVPVAAALILLPGAMLLTSCGPDEKQAALMAEMETELATAKQSSTRLENDLKKSAQDREEAEKRHSEILKRNEELMKKNDELEGKFEQLQDEAAKARRELQDYMAKYKISARGKLKGLQVPKLDTADGKSYQAVVFKEVTPTELSFSHSGGMARLSLEKAPVDIQKKCLYDPEEIKALEEAKKASEEAVEGLAAVSTEVKIKDPTRPFNPITVNNLKSRISTRRDQIKNIDTEIKQVQQSSFADSAIGKYRVQVLKQRGGRINNDIKELVAMLDKELNG